MDDNAKNASSYQSDQEILDARGINMTVQEVAGLPTTKYSERVQSLKLSDDDLAFLKGLRRRIKNRLASQNSRRRSVEHLSRLTRELRAVRACRADAIAERRSLTVRREAVLDKCQRLRMHITQILKDRSDSTQVPSIDIETQESQTEPSKELKKITVTETKSPLLAECFKPERDKELKIERDKTTFECRIDKLVQQSVNHIYKNERIDKKKVFAKTVFITNDFSSDVKSVVLDNDFEVFDGVKGVFGSENGVLNLSVKEGRRKGHGRKQSAPRRIAYYTDSDDGVLDLKIKKESQ